MAKALLTAFIDNIEGYTEEAAREVGIEIRIEKDSRGRFPSFTVRAVGRKPEGNVISRKVNGRQVKAKEPKPEGDMSVS